MRPFANGFRCSAVALSLTALASCSEYLDHRDGVSVYAGKAVAGNQVVQMIDPWPRAAANRNIAHDGVVMGRAVARYRAGQVIPPHLGGTSSAYQDAAQASAPADAPQSGGSGPPQEAN